MLAGIQRPSLAEKEKEFDAKKVELLADAEQKLAEVEKLLEQYSDQDIRNLSNGELEKVVNTLLRHKVRESHVGTLERIFNAARYGGFKPEDILSNDLTKKVEFRGFVQEEAKAERNSRQEQGRSDVEKHAGKKLMTMITEFSRNYAKDVRYQEADPFDIMERIVDAAARNLDDIESRSAYALIAYLRAKRMLKPTNTHSLG